MTERKTLTTRGGGKVPNWTNQEPFVVVEEMLHLNWGGRGSHIFCCGFCHHRFEVNDEARWVYVEGCPNTFVCKNCDGSDVVERFQERWRTVIKPILDRWC